MSVALHSNFFRVKTSQEHVRIAFAENLGEGEIQNLPEHTAIVMTHERALELAVAINKVVDGIQNKILSTVPGNA